MAWVPMAVSALGGLYASQQGGKDGQDTSNMPGFQEDAFRDLVAQAEGLMGEGIDPFPGTRVADINPQLMEAFNAQLAAADGMQGTADQASGALGMLLDPSMLDPSQMPGFGGAMDDVTRRHNINLQENVLPGLQGQAVAGGMAGSSRDAIAQGLASSRSQDNLTGTLANMQVQGHGQGLQAMLSALGMSPQVQGMQAAPGQMMAGVGQQLQAHDQMRLDDTASRWMESQMLPWQNLQMASGIFGNNMGQITPGQQMSSGEAGLGTFLALLGAMNQGDWGG